MLNEAAYGYMRNHSLSAPLIASLAAQPQTAFADQAAWPAHLDRLGFTTLEVTPNPVRVATEGALWGSVSAGTRSDAGRDCRDTFLGLAKTCDKLGIAMWDYLGSRLKVAGHRLIQPLDHYVRGRVRPA